MRTQRCYHRDQDRVPCGQLMARRDASGRVLVCMNERESHIGIWVPPNSETGRPEGRYNFMTEPQYQDMLQAQKEFATA